MRSTTGTASLLMNVGYMSKPICPFTEDELAELWEHCSEKNERLGITSALYYDETIFFQVLEGDDEIIEPLLETIRKDPRHQHFKRMFENDIASRSYPYWPMKFIDGTNAPRLQERFAPDALSAMQLVDLNANAFLLSRL